MQKTMISFFLSIILLSHGVAFASLQPNPMVAVLPGAILEPHLLVSEPKALIDEAISIRATELKPHQRAIISAILIDKEGKKWRSFAEFQADNKGVIDLDTQRPLFGTYDDIDGMGLFWSMLPENEFPHHSFYSRGLSPIEITLRLEIDGKTIAEEIIWRQKIAPDIVQENIHDDGLVASLLYPKGKGPCPVVIYLSGSEGGLTLSRPALLASHGYACLSLAYFKEEGLPKNLENIPLEYFQKVLLWLKNKKEIDGTKLIVMGASRGGELSLILASQFPESFKGAVAYVPSSVVQGGLGEENAHAWLYKGKPVSPFAPYGKVPPEKTGLSPKDAISTTPLFLKGMEDSAAYAQAFIPVEKIQCPLLLISGEDDQMWPSTFFCEQIMQRLQEKGSGIKALHLSYKDAGHYITSPYTPTVNQVMLHPFTQLWFAFGGTPKGQSDACRDSWKKVLGFIEQSFK